MMLELIETKTIISVNGCWRAPNEDIKTINSEEGCGRGLFYDYQIIYSYMRFHRTISFELKSNMSFAYKRRSKLKNDGEETNTFLLLKSVILL